MSRLKHRSRTRLLGGLVTLNWSAGRWTSTTFKLGPISINSRRTGAALDLPGGFHADLGERKRRR